LIAASLEALDLHHDLEANAAVAAAADGATTCLTCGIGGGAAPGFASPAEQRAHFKTDWHRYNVNRRLAGLAAVTEQQFVALLENEEEQDAVGSLSGSESDDSDEDEGAELGAAGAAAAEVGGPQFVFGGEDDARLAVWRCLVAPDRQRGVAPPSPAACLAELKRLREHGGRWAIILYRGGHFAAAVYDVVAPKSGAKAAAAAASLFKEVERKSFHRYVVRCGHANKQRLH
jgi:hypothetical protein